MATRARKRPVPRKSSGRQAKAGGRPRGAHLEVIRLPEDKPEYNMPYVPGIKARGGKTLFLSGVVAAPIYHHHPHRPEEFDQIPADGAGQARIALENLTRVLKAGGGTIRDIVYVTRFFTNLVEDQDAVNRVWNEFFGEHIPCITTVQITRLGTDPRLRLEIAAIAVVPK